MIKKIVVYILLFSFLLVDLPQGVLAAASFNYGPLFGLQNETNSTWGINNAILVQNQSTQKVLTHTISSTDNHKYVFKWEQVTGGTHTYIVAHAVGSRWDFTDMPGFYLYKISHNYLKDTSEQTISGSNYADIYAITRPSTNSSTSIPTPSTDSEVFGIFYKVAPQDQTKCHDSYFCFRDSTDSAKGTLFFKNMETGTDYSFPDTTVAINQITNGYIIGTGIYTASQHPKITSGTLPKAALDHCSSKTIKPDSQNSWALMNSMKNVSNDFQKDLVKAMKTDNLASEGAKPMDYTPFNDATKDIDLYHKYYSSKLPGEAGFYPDQVVNTGNSLDAEYSTELAEVWSWAPDEYQGNVWRVAASVLAIGDSATLVADAAAGSKATAAAIKVKIGAWAAAKQTAKTVSSYGYATAAEAAEAGDEAAAAALSAAGKTAAGAAAGTGATVESVGMSTLARMNLYAIAGTVLIGGAMWGVKSFVNSSNKEYYKKIWELLLVGQYEKKQIEYTDCIGDAVSKGIITEAQAAAAGFGADVRAAAKQVAANTYGAGVIYAAHGSNLASATATDYCKTQSGFKVLNPSSMFSYAFCTVSYLVYQGLAFIVGWANYMAQKIIGVTVTSQ